MAMDCLNQIIIDATDDYLSNYNRGLPPVPGDIEGDLLEIINDYIAMRNASISEKERKLRMLTTLPTKAIVMILLSLYRIVTLKLEGNSKVIAVYCDSGENEGLYDIDDGKVKGIIEQYNSNMTERGIADVLAKLERNAPSLSLTRDRDLIPVNNGVFDYKSKTLLPFSPDMVFTSKARINYNPIARNITIHNDADGTDWDIESWMKTLSDDPAEVNLFWEITGACIRPNVKWKKSVWLYSPEGNNGKGSLCQLMRNICGEESCSSISVEDFGTDAFLENLMRMSAVICDENDTGSYLDKVKHFKAAVTNDVVEINRKFRSTVAFRFYGLIIQCMNELPKVKDKSGSFTRRLLIVPMEKCFTGKEKSYIKDDYLGRVEVLEYALYKVLNMDYYELSVPKLCKNMLMEYKELNNPVVEFWNEFRDEFKWDLLPYRFLYSVYKEWHNRYYPSGQMLGYKSFCRDIKTAAANDTDWEVKGPVTTGTKMDIGEPIIGEYDLKNWMDNTYNGLDMNKKCRPNPLKSSYRGIVRVTPTVTISGTAAEENEEERS
ncbi:MAG: phage/plasmid primase, P4 family [Lachnospiraceae bacterium]|nr:phage/plasmid primase, P4 family [Lachnospiraceae bacterium]